MTHPWVDQATVIQASDAQRWDAKADPASAETITGTWKFDGAAAPTVASLLVPTLDFDTGEPIAGRGFILTANSPGTAGNMAVSISPYPPGSANTTPSQSLSVATFNDGTNGPGLYITTPTDADGVAILPVPSAAQIVSAVNAAGVPVTASLPAGSDGSDSSDFWKIYYATMTGGTDTPRVRLEGGAVRSALRVEPDELSQVPLTLRTADGSNLGTAALNVEYRDGARLRTVNGYTYGVSHLDNDGGGGFASDAITWSQKGHIVVDVPIGNEPLSLRVGGQPLLDTGTGQAAFAVSAITGSTAGLHITPHYMDATEDALIILGLDSDSKALRVRPDGTVITMGGEPADADLVAGQLATWYEPTASAPVVHFKAKDADGAVFVASLPMTPA